MTGSAAVEESASPQQMVPLGGQPVDRVKPERKTGIDPAIESSVEKRPTPTNPHRILLAEDDDEMRTLLAWRLGKDGYEVTQCGHGIDLINRIDPLGAWGESKQFDLVVSDIRMPGITGLEVLEDVRHCGTECPPVILITAFGDRETHEKANRLGVAAVFDKPFDFNDLLAKVHELVPPRSLPGSGEFRGCRE